MQEPQTPVADEVNEQFAPANGEPQPAQEVDPTVALRQAVAHNYLQHCVNHARTELDPAMPADQAMYQATQQGLHDALVGLILTAYQVNQPHAHGFLSSICLAMGGVEVDGEALPAKMMMEWAVAQSRQGKLNTLIGQLLDAAEVDRMTALLGEMNSLKGQVVALTPQPKKRPQAKPAKG